MKPARALKIIGAVLLLLSMTLPMSSCTTSKENVGEQVSSTTDLNSADSETQYHYIIDNIDAADPSTWITLLVFVWPVLMLGLLQWKKTGRMSLLLRGLELLLIIGSLIWIEFIATFLTDRREIGAYLAHTAIVVYAIGAIWSDVGLYRNWKKQRADKA